MRDLRTGAFDPDAMDGHGYGRLPRGLSVLVILGLSATLWGLLVIGFFGL